MFEQLVRAADVLIDPYRPGVLERLGLGPQTLRALNPRLIIARLTGFRRDGKYAQMAGHDINYIAVSGVLAMLGRQGDKPYAPGNLLADFAGGGLMCFSGILLALAARGVSGRGQVVDANMVDGTTYLASMPRFAMSNPMWDAKRGTNLLDGGCPWYDTYETKDGQFMAVGCLEEQFYAAFLKGLGLAENQMPDRRDKANWAELKKLFESRFKDRTRSEWENIFDGTDSCVTPVLSYSELHDRGFRMRPPVDLDETPGMAVAREKKSFDGDDTIRRGQGSGVDGEGYQGQGLVSGSGGEEVIKQWTGSERGKQYELVHGGCELVDVIKSKL